MKKILFGMLLMGIVLVLYVPQLSAKGWEYQQSNVHDNLTSISFVDSNVGWAVGENGVILSTTDGGENWEIMRPHILDIVPGSGTSCTRICNFYSVSFLDKNNGWAAGEMHLQRLRPEDIIPDPNSFGVILFTSDGGLTWECQYPCSVWDDIVSANRPYMKKINKLFFLNAQQGWAVGEGFNYLATGDGGRTWQEESIGFWAIPEIRHTLTSTQWVSSVQGWVCGYQYNMFSPEIRSGFIAGTKDGGKTWTIDPFYPPTFAPVGAQMDLEIQLSSAWSVGEEGYIFRRGTDGWEMQSYIWPLSLPLPDFNAVGFADDNHGWIIGSHKQGFDPGAADPLEIMTIFRTDNGGEDWRYFGWNDPGKLNGIDLIGFTDAWAAGDDGRIIHYRNNEPQICFENPDPQTVYAGDIVGLNVYVKDLDGNDDIKTVSVDARSIGAGIITLKPSWQIPGDRRCVLYVGEAEVSSQASYGMHQLPIKAIDNDGASDSAVMEIFVITSWVEIQSTWAIPNPAGPDDKILLAAKVEIIAPKVEGYDDNNLPYNRIEKVSVDITELLQVDCTPDMDCIMIVEMTDPDNDGVYTYVVAPFMALPGEYKLPITAVDTLGHVAKKYLSLKICDTATCRFDIIRDGDVDGADLAHFAGYYSMIDGGGVDLLKLFAQEFGSTDCRIMPM